MNNEEIIMIFTENEDPEMPEVYLFDKKNENAFKEISQKLKNSGWKIIDINQYAVITPEDYNISASDLGYADETGKITVRDLKLDDETKRWKILRFKLNALQNVVDNKTVLIITYNDLFQKNSMFYNGSKNVLYETIRYWLKDGYLFNGHTSELPLNTLVLLETTENIDDFCMYGTYVNFDD